MFLYLEEILISTIHTLSLEAFAFFASFVEEVVAPIPSPTVMVVLGSFAAVQERTLYALVPLVLIGACGKTLGALVVYAIASKSEDFVINKFGRFFNVTQNDVDLLGSKLGNGFKDYVLLTIFRALPFVPSVLLSVGAGLLKIPLRVFVVSTFIGTIFRDSFYLYAGYIGLEALMILIEQSSQVETYIEISVALVVLIGIFVLYMRARRQTGVQE
ncbi:MAG: VTT domain-containing protein [Candidatus Pacebacteria bacterium]|nr:VTT domain-containing protein [Candidatus Paceibacterota bacterium]MCF7857253.1 VTT domain-containing protein [Candidatus Paceibacterota bacterium]